MCGHIGLLVNFVFSLTRIFHGNAGGMSSGHTWHWGTPERSHQIPLGKPGLVIPRCETLASRSVTFPLHQSRVQRCTPSPPLPCHEDLQLRVQRGERGKKRECKAKEKAHSCPTSTAAAAAKAQKKERKKKDQRLSIPPPQGAHETVRPQLELTDTSLQSGEKPCAASLPSATRHTRLSFIRLQKGCNFKIIAGVYQPPPLKKM